MRQFYLDIKPATRLQPGDTVALDTDESHHLFTVLRGGGGEDLNLVDGFGIRYTARAAGRDGRQALVQILRVWQDEQELAIPRLVLGLAVVKGKRFEWGLEKAVELGVHVIVPLQADRGVIAPGQGKQKRWRTILVSGLKQSGRSVLPVLKEPLTPQAAAGAARDGTVFFGSTTGPGLDAGPGVQEWTTLLDSVPGVCPSELTILIGPEGGWSDQETDALVASGAVAVSLGPHILRTETAAVAGLLFLQGLRRRYRSALDQD